MKEKMLILSHGKEHLEEKEDNYPSSICPECYNADTIILRHYSNYSTGVRTTKNKLFKITSTRVCYYCNGEKGCGCRWIKDYSIKKTINPDLVKSVIETIVCVTSFVISCYILSILNTLESKTSRLFLGIAAILGFLLGIILVSRAVLSWYLYAENS